jgi:hypothetical protein
VEHSHFQKLLSLAMGLLLISPCYAANPHAFAVNEDALARALPIDHEEESAEKPDDLLGVYRYASLNPEADANAESYQRIRALDAFVRGSEDIREQRRERQAAMISLFKRTHPFYCTENGLYRENQEKTGYAILMLEITYNQWLKHAWPKNYADCPKPLSDKFIIRNRQNDPLLETMCRGNSHQDSRDRYTCPYLVCSRFRLFCSNYTNKCYLSFEQHPIQPFYNLCPDKTVAEKTSKKTVFCDWTYTAGLDLPRTY